MVFLQPKEYEHKHTYHIKSTDIAYMTEKEYEHVSIYVYIYIYIYNRSKET